MKNIWDYIKRLVKKYIYVYDQIDTESAAERIKSGIWFKGPNVWILAFSIVIASVGLNVNSTAVIIGAMLISPLMGPIVGTGLALGTNDTDLLKLSAKNLLVMVVIALIASTLFFILSPLSLVNPTELEARTSPTIYDVLIALFGGLAGIFEQSRKERGTVLSGVAIATALMPPLCTAGYGLAHLNFHFFFGAMYLFIINGVFITLATYLMVKYLRFKTNSCLVPAVEKKRRNLISAILVIVLVPSIYSAVNLVMDNNFQRNVESFVDENRLVGRSYIYDYDIDNRHVEFAIAGARLNDSLKTAFFANAAKYKIKENRISLTEHTIGMSQEEMNTLINDVYTRTDAELAEKDARLNALQAQLDILSFSISELQHRADSLRHADDSLRAHDALLQHRLDSLI
ncbi:MAG: DUF389 domain-containing protein, partial [Bacteroidales bacterium]|nr:DUF389 domain-containing protein [Bacteroidales bacterium]